ncbi:AraC family transcriptional regulator ligand-binding domain-containing protein [Streptomyces sp. NPDC097595]|uniref:AraC family transcriptional regulator n=1 Tax=Streptomyces sp. NPDC097595 TaxID=3366090 RepID=UPI003806FF2D
MSRIEGLDSLPLVRGVALTGFPDLVRELGGRPDEILCAAGIDPVAVGRYDTLLSHRGVRSVLETAAEATGRPDLGRRLGLRQSTDVLGPVVMAGRTARTFGEAAEVFAQYVHHAACSVRVTSRPDEHLVFVELRFEGRRWQRYPQVTEMCLARGLKVLRLMLGASYRPLSVHLPHRALSPAADYARDYAAVTRFEEPRTGFTLPAADLARPLDHVPGTHRAMLQYLSGGTSPDGEDLIRSAGDVVARMLPAGPPTVEAVARRLDLHPRALQRRLAAEGLCFSELVDRIRRDTAERLLTETAMPLVLLSHRLGYAEQSALTRACRRWFGAAPSVVRRGAAARRVCDSA